MSAATLAPRRILVTGGAGFIGSHLCERMVRLGHDVLCADNYFTGSKENIRHLLDEPNFELIRHDVREPMSAEVDEIYNLACPASPAHYQLEPARTVETSILGTINMLRLAQTVRAVLLQASTSEVYGDPEVHPQTESYWGHVNPIGPRACYDEGKRCAEALCFGYREQFGVRIKVARIFNTYGPRLASGDGRVVSNFIVQALRDDPITIYGDGHQTRSFCYVDDMVAGLIKMMGTPDSVTGPINLGNPVECTIEDVAHTIVEMTNSRSKIVHLPLPVGDPVRRKPDIALAMEQIGWRPTVDFRAGLAKTIAYFERALSSDDAIGDPANMVRLTRTAIE